MSSNNEKGRSMTAHDTTVEVTQADRDAAADMLERLNVYAWERSVGHIRAGNADASYSVQAFARHRTRSSAKLAEAVEMLRDARHRGLIYWEPNTDRGAISKANMLARIDTFLAKLERGQ